MKMYEMSPDERVSLSKKVKEYADSEFSISDTVDMWHNTMNDTFDTWKENYKRWECITV